MPPALLLILSLALSVFGPAAWAADLRIGLSADVASMDPHFAAVAPTINISSHVFETLTGVDADTHLIPGLAESWRAVDSTTWEFKLRHGVHFHDGSVLTAADVIASLQRPLQLSNRPGGFATYVRPIIEMRAPDPYTVLLKTKTPYALLPYDLVSVFIVPEKIAKHAQAEDFDSGRAMIGTGPYRFVRFLRGDRIELARNDHYWGAEPEWQHVSLRILSADPARVAALMAGDVDMIENVPPSDMARLQHDARFHLERKVSWRTIFFMLDQRAAPSNFITDLQGAPLASNPLQDPRVRRALSLAIDRDTIATHVMEGLALPTANIVAPPVFGHVADLPPAPYDPATARALLAEAGYPNGFGLTVHAPNNRYVNDEQVAQAVAQMLAHIGIRVRVETLPINVYLPRARKPGFSFAMLGWGSFSGDLALRALMMSPSPEQGYGAWNLGDYRNPQLDALVEHALATIDTDAREALVRDAARLVHRDEAMLPLYHQIATWAMRKDLRYTARTDEFSFAFDVYRRSP
jgi:peptide/nickel transport system substrate-binding protein